MNEYLAIDSGEYLCTSSLRELIARKAEMVFNFKNRSAREKSIKAL